MLPGFIFAIINVAHFEQNYILKLFIGIICTCLIASANYVLNEWLDADFDKFHPIKKNRSAITENIRSNVVYLEYIVIAVIGLSIAYFLGIKFFFTSIVFIFMGIVYNVKPIRTKDIVYVDVLTESINNPIRLLLGWFIVINNVFPPVSLIFGYWMGGAFLMAIKRFAEYRSIGPSVAGMYRRSFIFYDENKLLSSAVFYAMCSTLFLGIFLIKHKLELIISFPFLCLLFAWYLSLGLKKDSIVQTPEKLIELKSFLYYSLFLFILLALLVKVEIPFLYNFFRN